MGYWHEKPGVGVNVVDKLLNYTILTPISVVMWALGDQLGKGEGLVHSHVFEMVSSTVNKVTNRVRQIVLARNAPGLPADQVAILSETLAKEREEMGKLFAVIEDALVGVAEGSVDAMAESADQDTKGEAMLRGWGARWLRVFKRKMAVEEAWVQEMLEQGEARAKALAAAAAAEGQGVDQAMEGMTTDGVAVNGSGVANGNGNGNGVVDEAKVDVDEIL